MKKKFQKSCDTVIRRVGGLEVIYAIPFHLKKVIRRVGGLEVEDVKALAHKIVIRRVGGLEDQRGRK